MCFTYKFHIQGVVFHVWNISTYLERTGSAIGTSGPLLLREADLTCPLMGFAMSEEIISELHALEKNNQELIWVLVEGKKKVRPLGLSTEKITHLGRSAAKLLVFSMLSDFPSLFIVERRTPGVSEELSVFVFVLAAACAPEIFVILQFLLTQISGLSSL